MYNKKTLSKAVSHLNKVKKPTKSRDMIYDPMGQWAHPGQNTRIPGGDITMEGVPYPVFAQPNVGQPQLMYPGQDYTFPGADYVDEFPQMKKGGLKKNKTSRNLMATNKLFAKHAFFKKPGKNVIFDPKSPNFKDGGFTLELDDDEIQAYKDGGYIVEDISVPNLTKAQTGGTYTYSGRKDSQYKKDANGKWLISNPSTGNKFVPLKDPTGERSAELNRHAVSNDYITTPTKQASESTDTAGLISKNKQIGQNKIWDLGKSIQHQDAVIDAKINEIRKNNYLGSGKNINSKENKKLQEVQVQKLKEEYRKNPMDVAKATEFQLKNQGSVKALSKDHKFKTSASLYDIATNPFDAFKYSVMTGDVSNMPANYNQFKQAGINPLDSHGGNLVGDQLNNFLNPVDMVDKTAYNIKKGNYGTAALHGLRFLPFLETAPATKLMSGVQKTMVPIENALSQPVINPSLVSKYVTSNPTTLNVAKNLTGNKILGMEAAYKALNMVPEVTKAGYDAYNQTGKDPFKKFLEKTGKLIMYSSPILTELKHASPVINRVNDIVNEVKPYYNTAKGVAKSTEEPKDMSAKDVLSTVRAIPKLQKLGGQPDAMETELTDAEIEQLRKQGYVIELI